MKKNLRQRDYSGYRWKKGELALAILLSAVITVFFAVFFYRSAIAVLPMSAIGVFCFRSIRTRKIERTKKELTAQFRECILSVSASLRAGYAVENAFRECRRDMELLYGEGALICGELDYIRRGLDINITLEELLADLAARSGCPGIREFAQVFVLAKRNGGSMPDIIRSSAAVIGRKIELQQEIATMLSGKQMEQNIMKLMPFGILLYISVTNHGYFDVLYHNWQGAALMTGCLGVYLLAYAMGERVMGKIQAEMG
ncbi:MAG: type II secretion system F family protein [Lachnospiraceae bacterium]|nr:type II secretion system F family protein [Butyrivibrio sp.]MCM1343285.1 type II secretion system F family protein [Muribaculaceae bacterium]MCM1409317.1 type II secretion system F family protein [Lachnospiraceae bacterium]